MANFQASNIATTSARLYIENMNTASTYSEVFITFQGVKSPNLVRPAGNSSSLFWERTGLSPSTTYSATYTLLTAAGSPGSGSGSFTTLSLPSPPPTPTNFRLNGTGANAIPVAWNVSSGANNYVVEVYHSATGAIQNIYGNQNYNITGTSFNANGLVEGVYYDLKLYAVNAGGNSTPTWLYGKRAGIPLPDPPATPTNFRLYDNINNSLALAWNSASGASNYVIEVYHAATGNIQNIYNNANYNITGTSFLADGLVNGVTYDVKLYASNAGGNSIATWLYGVRAGKNRPANFSWVSAKTRGASYSISNKNVTNLITRSEVIALQTRINEFRLYKGLTSTSFPSRTVGEVFTSTVYNQLKNAITAMNPPTSPSSSTNLIDLLNGLRDSLNSIT